MGDSESDGSASPGNSTLPRTLWRRWDSLGEGSTESDDSDPAEESLVETSTGKRLYELGAIPFLTSDTVKEDKLRAKHGVDVDFLPGLARVGLRNVTSIVLVLLVVLLVDAELSPDAVGVLETLPPIPLVPVVGLGVIGAGISALLITSDIVDRETLVRVTVVYGLAGFLFVGSIYATYRTLSTRGGDAIDPHAVYGFPTLLFSLLIGLLAYDLLLKGETLFSKLGEKNILHDSNYESVKDAVLKPKLQQEVAGLKYGHLFMIGLLAGYLVIWSFKGPLGTSMPSMLLLNVTINLMVLVGVFNFLIGIIFLRKLLDGELQTADGETVQPTYLPYHPDRHGGYGDIGKCALQINLLIVLIGFYYVYRAYISGLRSFPSSAESSLDPFYAQLLGIDPTPTLELTFWAVNFLGPIFLYALVVVLWFYYTFYEIHKHMVTQKKQTILQWQRHRRNNPPEDTVSVSKLEKIPLGGEIHDKEHWQELYDAPEWPINARKLGAVFTGNIVPVLLSLPTVLPDLLSAWG